MKATSNTILDFDDAAIMGYQEGDEFIRLLDKKNHEDSERIRFAQINARSEKNKKMLQQQRKAAEERQLLKEARMNAKARRTLAPLVISITIIGMILFIGLTAYVYNEQSMPLTLLCGAGIPTMIFCAYKALKLVMKFNILDV